MNQVLTQFGDIEPFLEENQDIAPRLADHLRVLLEDQDRRKLLIMELTAVIDAGELFIKATYILEGDGLLVFSAYSTLQALSTAAAQRIVRMLLPKRTHWLQVQRRKQLSSNMPAHVFDQVSTTFCRSLIDLQFYKVVRAFNAARHACPMRIQEL